MLPNSDLWRYDKKKNWIVERFATPDKFIPAVALVLLAWSGCDVGYAMFLVCVGKY